MKRERGFTIVELLIVIIVIGILAALVLVAYGSVTDQAKVSAAKNDLEQVAKQLNTYKEQSGGGSSYPADASALTYSNGTTLQYSVNNSLSPATYCVTATNGNKSYYVSNANQAPTAGGCPGHGVNGQSPLTNLVTLPSFETGNASGIGYNNAGIVSNSVSAAGAYSGSYGLRSTLISTTSMGNVGPYQQVTGMTTNQTYTASVWVRSSRAVNYHITAERRDASNANIGTVTATDTALTANTWTRLSLQVPWITNMNGMTFCVYSATTSWNTGDTVDYDGYMVTAGTTLATYADGSSPNWVWNGTANGSTSTGPAL